MPQSALSLDAAGKLQQTDVTNPENPRLLRFVDGPLTVVDIGGQDAKIILVDGEGRRVGHKMNRKCAAGTGSFLEEMALRLDVRIGELPALAAASTEELELGSFCTVFAGTELLTLIRGGHQPADLAMAAYRSLVKRIVAMDVLQGCVVATGGVIAHHPTMVRLLSRELRVEIMVPPHPQEMGAFGAALAARDGAASVGPAASDVNPIMIAAPHSARVRAKSQLNGRPQR